MKVESTVTTTDIQEIEVVTGVFVKFTKTKRDDKVSFSGEVYKRTESKSLRERCWIHQLYGYQPLMSHQHCRAER